MAIENDKLVNLHGAKILYDDLRGRTEALIDDTSTALNNVWSAHKVSEEFAETNGEVTDLKSAKAPIIMESISTPADVQTFPDGADGMLVKNLTVEIDPVQDLHGYDSPWPAGGNVNICSLLTLDTTTNGITVKTEPATGKVTVTGTASADTTVTLSNSITMKANTSYDAKIYNVSSSIDESVAKCRATGFGWVNIANNAHIGLNNASAFNTSIVVQVYSGKTINASFYPMFNEGNQTTDYTPYENLCPITGHTGANVVRTGKNLFGGLVLGQAIVDAVNNADFSTFGSNTDGNYVTIIAGSAVSNKKIKGTLFKPNTQYTLIFKITRYESGNKSVNIKLVYTDGTVGGISVSTTSDTEVKTVVYVTTSGKTVDHLETTFGGGTAYLFYEQSGIFEGVLTETDFEAYVDNVYAYTFPSEAGTVYGGTLTIHQDGSGELVANHADLDLGTIPSWTKITTSGSHWRFYAYLNTAVPGAKLYCSNYKWITASAQYLGEQGVATQASGSNVLVMVSDEAYSDTAEFKTAMSGVHLVYELATAVTYQLTNQQVIETLKGQNNVWADTGKINAVDYPADTKLYIDKKFTELQALVLEN